MPAKRHKKDAFPGIFFASAAGSAGILMQQFMLQPRHIFFPVHEIRRAAGIQAVKMLIELNHNLLGIVPVFNQAEIRTEEKPVFAPIAQAFQFRVMLIF